MSVSTANCVFGVAVSTLHRVNAKQANAAPPPLPMLPRSRRPLRRWSESFAVATPERSRVVCRTRGGDRTTADRCSCIPAHGERSKQVAERGASKQCFEGVAVSTLDRVENAPRPTSPPPVQRCVRQSHRLLQAGTPRRPLIRAGAPEGRARFRELCCCSHPKRGRGVPRRARAERRRRAPR